jgi:hypothetical protein
MIQGAETCVDCHAMKTTNRSESGEAVCATCSNRRHSKRISNGEIVVLKIDMNRVKHSTILTIRHLIQKDMEDSK